MHVDNFTRKIKAFDNCAEVQRIQKKPSDGEIHHVKSTLHVFSPATFAIVQLLRVSGILELSSCKF